jgi:hypothetical protein
MEASGCPTLICGSRRVAILHECGYHSYPWSSLLAVGVCESKRKLGIEEKKIVNPPVTNNRLIQCCKQEELKVKTAADFQYIHEMLFSIPKNEMRDQEREPRGCSLYRRSVILRIRRQSDRS